MRLKDFYKMHREKIILTSSALGIGILSLGITLLVYNADINNNTTNINQENDVPEINNNYAFNQDLTEAQKIVAENLIAKLDELNKQDNQNNEHDEYEEPEYPKVDNTIQDNNVIENNVENTPNEVNNIQDEPIQEDVVETLVKTTNNEVSFIVPVDGKVGMDFSDKNLVYSKTLKEWISHNGIDYITEIGTEVKAGADGIIKNIYNDIKYGITVVIEHNGGYISKYSGLQEIDNLEIGQKIKQGDVISKVAEGFGFEKEEGSHLHFEVIKDGKNIRPNFI